ncbi:hypothetical protein TBLA_0A01980 [Henningerozyma blattae CBS 6284]|uniref:Smr domain-containing protein n=1 Tax=Henningerozyma blattae (strain ATCC 34711 / CBS 6284 / DSM 70876 / NBRC 10599 / NRRL Y-10934 / UCD 77-7) TaxID=1071380 RepID=I2GV47_HENB6|nr:hypothetical protein TBLA_0A01980 [Tetrapisispora blattae CBS 6284]CCH57999.1 hypothetical protein TBLA_0A01980 [Tetrapisispora blattae CBS 6284]
MATAVLDRGVKLGYENDQTRDYNHATDSQYENLRKLADQAYKKKQEYSSLSQQAYKSGNKSEAHELSLKAKEQVEIAEKYNMQAAEYVFVENNADSDSNEIDLHGLFVKEAQFIVKRRIIFAINHHEDELKIIVGKGLHSKNGVAKIRPAIQELCNEANLEDHIDQKNSGVLVVNLRNGNVPEQWYKDAKVNNNNVIKPNNSYQNHGQQQQQYYNQQQQPHYAQQQQPQYIQQQPQQQNSSQDTNPIASILLLLCTCLSKNM